MSEKSFVEGRDGGEPDRRSLVRSAVGLLVGAAAASAFLSPAIAQTAGPMSEPSALPMDVASLFSLKGKVAVVTDSGGLASREIAMLLAAAGASVTLADRDIGKARAVVAEITGAGGRAAAVRTDIESEKAVVALFRDVAAKNGALDILVNCAGMTANRALTETTSEIWDAVQSLNLKSNFLCMREGIRQMVAFGKGGRVVNVTTIGAVQPVLNGNESYGAARAGVIALSRDAALDYAKNGIRVNTVLVGAVKDRVRVHETQVAEEKAGKVVTGPVRGPDRLPLGAGHKSDVAAAVLYLVAPAGRYITGQSIVLDGGFFLT